MIFSSISSFICKFSLDGRLEWCNAPSELQQLLGVSDEQTSGERFDAWIPDITSAQVPRSLSLRDAIVECLRNGTRARTTNAEMVRKGSDGDAESVYVNFALTPLHRTDFDAAKEVQVGVLLVIEDVSEQHRRKAAEEKLSEANKQLSKIEEQLNNVSTQMADTPLQRAINVVNELIVSQPGLHGPLQEILVQLTSRDVLLPSLMTDSSKMAGMDDFMRDFLGNQTGVLLQPESEQLANASAVPADHGSLDGQQSWKEHALAVEGKRETQLADGAQSEKSFSMTARRSSNDDIGSRWLSQDATAKLVSPREQAARAVDSTLMALNEADWISPSVSLEHLDDWNLDLFSLSPTELLATSHALFHSVDMCETLKVPEATLRSFIVGVSQGYLPMPFHNFVHATYVLHGCVVCMKRCALLKTLLRPLERVAICVAALGHDIGHLGVQNGFLVNANDPLALQYNDRSVLENMHCSRLFSVLRQRGCGLLDGLTPDDYKSVRKMIIGMIMATDLSHHFDDMSKFASRMQNPEPWSIESAADRQMAIEMVLHASDLSGPTRPWPISSTWAGKVQEEFVKQVEREERLGIPVSKFLTANKAKLETGFIDLFVNPLWSSLHKLLPELSDRVEQMTANFSQWKQQLGETPA
jgi:hypothetical protein